MGGEFGDSQNNTCFSATDYNPKKSSPCHGGSRFIPAGRNAAKQWKSSWTYGTVSPWHFSPHSSSPCWELLLKTVSDKTTNLGGCTRLSQTTAIRHSWFRYKHSEIETGNIGVRPFVVRPSHLPFLFLAIQEFRVAISISRGTICTHVRVFFSFFQGIFWKLPSLNFKNSIQERDWRKSSRRAFATVIHCISQAKCDRPRGLGRLDLHTARYHQIGCGHVVL